MIPFEVLEQIDEIARDYIADEYGLPTHDEHTVGKMKLPIYRYGQQCYNIGIEDGKKLATKILSIEKIIELYSEWMSTIQGDSNPSSGDFIVWLKIKLLSQ